MSLDMNANLQEAALLLQEVAKIAHSEVKHDDMVIPRLHTIINKPSEFAEVSCTDVSDSSESRYAEDRRFRTIFKSYSHSTSASPVIVPGPLGACPMLPPFTLANHIVHTVSPTPRTVILPPFLQPPIMPVIQPTSQPYTMLQHCKHIAPSPMALPPSNKSKYVGTSTAHKVKGILKRKFSWKNYPDLEGFLIGKREEYLQHSSAYNYTVTQKDFNNKLTTELLKLASSLGYIFDRFSFVQIRDRIRCYYKSYLQSLKKHKP
eukprot:CAMPEP_0119012262 /NCGR_PEP_ID=MMETSP1176-20130426/6181_1 /TAXON_ID=265551 /ORGANISM="Synedropsis recta cf, Strain CCMP1620" /LENGTH=261 /DNA_ID=CAMNT_0006965183 /DNA_START=96 /DNA_END=881 /DNA_ORIENTATION=+